MDYLMHLGILFSIMAMLAVSLNLVVGYTGMLSVANGAFYGAGAYTTALLMRTTHCGFLLAVLGGVVVAGLLAWGTSFVFSRFRGDYFALATIGFSVIVYSVLLNWQELTRGALGIPGIPRPVILGVAFTQNATFLLLALGVLALVLLLAQGITRSSFGRVLMAIREDEDALKVFGYNTRAYKMLIYVLGAAIAAVAGGLFAAFLSFIDPNTFDAFESIFELSIVIMGGLASHRGSLIGACLLLAIAEAMRFIGFPPEIAGQMRQVVYGLILVGLMLFRPQGLVGRYRL